VDIVIDTEAYTVVEAEAGAGRPLAASPAALWTTLAQMMELGVRRFTCPADRRVIAALADLRRLYRFEVDAVIVNAAVHSREMQTYGMAGFARRRFAGVRPLSLPTLGIEGVRQARSLLAKDFRSAVSFLGLLELSAIAVLRPRRVFLHQTGVDLATATSSQPVFEALVRLARRSGLVPGVISTNAGYLLPDLARWGTPVEAVATPVISSAYHMNPTLEAAAEAARAFRGDLAAVYPGPAANVSAEDIELARSVGAKSLWVRLFDAPAAIRLQDLLAGTEG
jgi:hypothetical protein